MIYYMLQIIIVNDLAKTRYKLTKKLQETNYHDLIQHSSYHEGYMYVHVSTCTCSLPHLY